MFLVWILLQDASQSLFCSGRRDLHKCLEKLHAKSGVEILDVSELLQYPPIEVFGFLAWFSARLSIQALGQGETGHSLNILVRVLFQDRSQDLLGVGRR